MQIVLDTRGLQLSVRNRCFLFHTDKESHIVHPDRISSILVTSPCRISSPALILAAVNQIPVIISDNCGKPAVRIWSPCFINTSKLRRAQYNFSSKYDALDWFSDIIKVKIEGQLSNLNFITNRKPNFENKVNSASASIERMLQNSFDKEISTISDYKKIILYNEAFAASKYWQLIGLALPKPFYFTNRTKKNPNDAFNACINYLYGMLRNKVETAILSIGLDPALGIMHRDGYKMPSLVFDLMEPFRPIMDRLLMTAIFKSEIQDQVLQLKDGIPKISKETRKKLIEYFVEKTFSRCIYRGFNTNLNNHILSEVKRLSTKIREFDNNEKI